MRIAEFVQNMLGQSTLAVPKECYSREEVMRIAGQVVDDTAEDWLIQCKHIPSPPATMEGIARVEQELGIALPHSFRQFLLQTDGGEFFVVPRVWLHDVFPNARHVRYHIFGTSTLVSVNLALLRDFRVILGEDPGFREVHALNYVAFCDAHNGNYLALLTDKPQRGKVFFLDREYMFRPYAERFADMYYDVAQSFQAWLLQIISTNGWAGFGAAEPGL